MSKVYVTKPYLPAITEYLDLFPALWESRNLTNGGAYHQALEDKLRQKLVVQYLSLINNGTIALEIAIQALGLKGKIITTPYSFVATANSILLRGLTPVFIDIEDDGFNLDPELIEDVIDSEVSAVMPVHVYGIPCDNEGIELIAKNKGLKVIYDAAHAFGVTIDGDSILNWGDASALSFHATKVFHTFEGGAVVCNNPVIKQRIEELKNFGIDPTGDVIRLFKDAILLDPKSGSLRGYTSIRVIST